MESGNTERTERRRMEDIKTQKRGTMISGRK